MKEELKNYIAECTICQKIKWQRPENGEDIVEHHLYSVAPLSELSIDTLGLLPEDEAGMRFIILIVDNFSKFGWSVPIEQHIDKRIRKSVPILDGYFWGICRRLSEAMEVLSSPPIWPKHSKIS